MKAWPYLIFFVAACGAAVPEVEPQNGASLPWCFQLAADVRDDKNKTTNNEEAEFCFEYEDTCGWIRGMVVKWGRLKNVTAVGECKEW